MPFPKEILCNILQNKHKHASWKRDYRQRGAHRLYTLYKVLIKEYDTGKDIREGLTIPEVHHQQREKKEGEM